MSNTSKFEVRLAEVYEDLGYEDVLILQPETFSDLFTEKRREIVKTLLKNDFESIRELANSVDREPSAVHRDLKELFEHDLISFEEIGIRNKPVLKHDSVTVYPFDLDQNSDNKTADEREKQ